MGAEAIVAIYTKYGKRIFNDSIRIDAGCRFGHRVFRIWASVEGRSNPQLLYVSDLLADKGKEEIDHVIRANRKKR